MIKIEKDNIDQISDLHLAGILPWLEPRIDRALVGLGASPSASPLRRLVRDDITLKLPATWTIVKIREEVGKIPPGAVNGVVAALAYAKAKLEDVLVGKPARLADVDAGFKQQITAQHGLRGNEADDLLKRIFAYGYFREKALARWDAYDLAAKLEVNVCPYCNRQFTTTVRKQNGEGIVRPEFDHFFPQGTHPLLALSLYNLVPCCSTCNSRACKGDDDFCLNDNVHPYVEGFGEEGTFTFTPQALSPGAALPDVADQVKISLNIVPDPDDPDKKARVEENCRAFNLDVIYESHADVVSEILWKGKAYPGGYVEALRHMLDGRLSTDDVNRIILGNYTAEKDLDKRPLAKLTRDIAKELGLI
jgi:hypothetical protein